MKKPKIKIIGNILYWLVIIVLIITGSTMALFALDIPGDKKLYTVQSGSMEPAIKTGSIVLTQPSEKYKNGDIITYKSENDRENPNPEFTTTHRIVYEGKKEGKTVYTTKGDANNGVDGNPVDKELVLGKVIFSLPLIGYLVAFSRTQLGLITLIIIPSTIIVYSELQSITDEIKKLIERQRERKLKRRVQEEIYSLFNTLEKAKK